MDYLQQTNLGRGLTDLIRRISAGADGRQIGEDLFGVADLLRENNALERALTDPGRSAQDRQDLARKVFEPAVSTEAMQSVYDLVGDKWSHAHELASVTSRLGLDALMLSAVKADDVATVAEELISTSLIVGANRQLRIQLSDLGEGDAAERAELARKIFHGHVSPISERLIMRAVYTSTYGRLLQTLRTYADRSAELDGKHLVVLTTAQPLSAEQKSRMTALAERRWDRPVELVAVTNPDIIGGFRLDGGDRSVDTSIGADIAAAKLALAR